MIPVSNGSQSPCSPISSNCVIWQGPDIPCISLCNGDTVSDVIAKLASELCDIIDQACQCEPDLQGLDLKCVLPSGDTPPQTLTGVLQLIIDYICDVIPGPGPGEVLPVVTLPPCLWYNDPVTGNPIKALPLDQYAAYLAGKICNILTSISIINQTILDIESRLVILENCVLPCSPSTGETQVISQCIIPGGQLVNVSTLLLGLESAFCNLQNATGDPATISQTINQQCLFGSSQRLSGLGTYAGVSGWQASPSTLAQSVRNIWIILCDMYAAVTDIKDNCCNTGCDAVQFGFTYNVVNDGFGVPTSLNLNFTSSNIPAAYNDCGGSTTLTITDSGGNSITQAINVKSLSTNPAGVTIALTGLNVYQSLFVVINFCVTDGINLCSESSTQIVPLQIPCPVSYTITPTTNTVAVSFLNGLGPGVVYVIKVTDTTTNVLAGSFTVNTPGSSVSHTFTGLAVGTTYTVTVDITSGTTTRICNAGTFATLGITCADVVCTTVDPMLTMANADIVLGFTGDIPGSPTGSATYYGYNIASNKLIVETLTQDCGAPTISSPSITLGGTVTISLSWPFAVVSEVDITTEYSSDNVTWSGAATAGTGSRTIITGITTGQVYIRAVTNCSGPDTSLYAVIAYDFATAEWRTLAAPDDMSNSASMLGSPNFPYGTDLYNPDLTCGLSTYTVPGFATTGRWFYFGPVYVGSTVYYAYAGWTDNTSPTPDSVVSLVLCCECPAYIIGTPRIPYSEYEVIYCNYGNNVPFTLDYILGTGTPIWSIVNNATNGTVTYLGGNSFEYTNTVNSYGDTVTISLTSSTGSCTTSTRTVQIQLFPCNLNLRSSTEDIYAFIDTNTISTAEAPELATALTNVSSALGFSGWIGNMYVIPVADSEWLGYQKAIVDDGISAAIDVSGPWPGITNLPTSWTGGTVVNKNRGFVIAFSNESNPDYHDISLAAGWGAGPTLQPTTDYKENYQEFFDSQNGPSGVWPAVTYMSTWASALNFSGPQFPEGFTGIYYPVNNSPANATAAAILQGLACYVAQMIPPGEYGVQTAVDVTAYLMTGVTPSATNPYQGAPTNNPLLTISGLWNQGWMMFLNQKETWEYDSVPGSTKLDADILQTATGCLTGSLPVVAETRYRVVDCTTNESFYVSGITGGPYNLNQVLKLTNLGPGTPTWLNGQSKCMKLDSLVSDTFPAFPVIIASGPYANCGLCPP